MESPLPAAAGLLAPAQLQIRAQAQLPGHLVEALLAHQGRPDAGQVPLRRVRVLAEEELRRHKAQHGVPQELQPLVAPDAGGPVLVGIGAVVQRLLQQGRVPEAVIKSFSPGPACRLSPKRRPRCPRGLPACHPFCSGGHIVHRVAHGLDGLDLVLRRLTQLELLLHGHHQLHQVHGIGAQVVLKGRLQRHLVRLHAKLLGHQVPHRLKNLLIRHVVTPPGKMALCLAGDIIRQSPGRCQ